MLAQNNDFIGILDLFKNLKQNLSSSNMDDVHLFQKNINDSIGNTINNIQSPINWNSLVGEQNFKNTANQIILLQPKLDFTRLLPGQDSVETINKIISETQEEVIDPFNVAITGGAALAYDELKC